MGPEPIVVDFPLRGDWVAYHTPAERVPSHGTDQLGQRYAYDFMQIEPDKPGWKFCRASMWRHHVLGVPLSDCYGWGQPIHAPFSGSVVAAEDGWRERKYVHLVSDLAVVLKNALTFDPARGGALRVVLGNYVVLKMLDTDVFALVAHARTGSIRVRKGDAVAVGEHFADVGHSGNSTAPHLHFQLMDRPTVLEAAGIPCAFRGYEALRDGKWLPMADGIPAKRQLIRNAA